MQKIARVLLTGIVGVGSLLGSTLTLSQQNQTDALALLDDKQAEIALRNSRIEEINQAFGKYRLIRDGRVINESGLKKMATDISAAKMQWLQDWYPLLAVADAASAQGDQNFYAEMEKIVKSQSDNFAKISVQIVSFRSAWENAQKAVAHLPQFSENHVKGYEKITRSLNDHIANIKLTTKKADVFFQEDENKQWLKLAIATERVVTIRLKKALLRYPELASAVSRTQEMFQVEREIDPILQNVHRAYIRAREDILLHRYFASKESLTQLDATVAQAEARIVESQIDAEWTTPARNTLHNWQSTARRLFEDATRSFPKAHIVQKHFLNQGHVYAAACRDKTQRLQVNCELFSFVYKTPSRAILEMNDEQLTFLEQQVDLIRQGPLSGVHP